MTCLPRSPASVRIASTVASSVSGPRISSTSGMTGTGLKKCIPMNRRRRPGPTAAARSPMEIEDVFVAKIAASGAATSRSDHSRDLTSTSSKTASMTRSAAPACPRSAVGSTRARVVSRSSAPSRPLLTARSRLAAIRSRPAWARVRSGSYRSTWRPIWAWTWAMPWPISPAPATNTRSIRCSMCRW